MEPGVGEKRRREDGDEGPSDPDTGPSSAKRSNSGGEGNIAYGGTVDAHMMSAEDSGPSGVGFNDALYLGDLQWVRRVLYCVFFCIMY